jgi:predicted restriction endonuclease
MSDWSWKQTIADCVLEIANTRSTPHFSIDDVWSFRDRISQLFPRNRHVREKTRQTLQRLRDDGFLVFHGRGKYELNLEHEDLEGDPAPLRQKGFELPKIKKVVRSLRLRCTLLATEIKRRYGSICQLCGLPVVLFEGVSYAEAHHLRPLGYPHFGPDIPGNILVVCPNHHVMFDRGVVTVVPDTKKVLHVVPGAFRSNAHLRVQPWHNLDTKYLAYHHERIFRGGVSGVVVGN